MPRLGKAGEHGEFGLLEFGLFPPVDCPGRLGILRCAVGSQLTPITSYCSAERTPDTTDNHNAVGLGKSL